MSRVTEHLEAIGVDYEVLPHQAPPPSAQVSPPPPRTNQDETIRAVVLDIRTGHAVAVIPSASQVDIDRVKQALNASHVTLATDEEIARDFPEFDADAIPPLGALARTPVIVDPDVFEHDYVVFAAGTQDELVRVKTRTLFDNVMARVAPICCD